MVPDLVTLAKPAGNGHPLGAVITTRAIADEFDEREDLFSSPGGSPVSCEVGLAVLDALERERLQDNARAVGEHLTERLAPLAGELRARRRALHGIGLYRGLELERADGSPASAEAFAICERLLELGVIVQPTGPDDERAQAQAAALHHPRGRRPPRRRAAARVQRRLVATGVRQSAAPRGVLVVSRERVTERLPT